jgi:hypothetical protein
MARDVAVMFDELKAMADRRLGAASGGTGTGAAPMVAAGLHMGSHITCGLRCWSSTVPVGGVDAPAASRPFPSEDRPAAAPAPKPPCAAAPPRCAPRPCDTSAAARVVPAFCLRDGAAQPASPLRPQPPTFRLRDVPHQVCGGPRRSRLKGAVLVGQDGTRRADPGVAGDRHRAGRQEPAGCILAVLPPPSPSTSRVS